MMRLGIHQGQANAKPVASVNDANSIPGALPDELEIRAKNLLHDVPSGELVQLLLKILRKYTVL